MDRPTTAPAIQMWITKVRLVISHMFSMLPAATTDGIADRSPLKKRPNTTTGNTVGHAAIMRHDTANPNVDVK